MIRDIEQVIILGAGASKSEGTPLQNELFKVFFKEQLIFEDIKKSDKSIWNLVEEQETRLKDFFNEFWGINIMNYKNKDFPTFEECNAQQLFGVVYELIRLKSSQRSKKTQSIAMTIFAPFAFFAVNFLCYPSMPHDATGLHKKNTTKLAYPTLQQICVHLRLSAVFFLKFDTLFPVKLKGS